MGNGKAGWIVPLLIIAVGIAWLLNTMNFIRGIDWVWTLGLAAVGVVTLITTRINKLTFVVGSFLVLGSVCSVLRQIGYLDVNTEVPILVILLGVLMMTAHAAGLPGLELPPQEQQPGRQ